MGDNTFRAASHICDSELDMRRTPIRALGRPLFGSTLGRVFLTLLRSAHGETPFGSPRRSVDREQQQYSPPSD
jgi:hypothetical protein